MNKFIQLTKQCINRLDKVDHVKVIVGNESCDLDSAVSSLVYGFFLYWNSTICQYDKLDIPKSGSVDQLFIPLLNVCHDDLLIKTEVTFLLKKYNIDLENLICLEDITCSSVERITNFEVTLVDHHIITDKLSFLKPYVTEILDHRPKDTTLWSYSEDVKATLSNVGSCSTLVCSEIFDKEHGVDFLSKNTIAASMLYDTIILDTVNFLPKADRAKPLDYDMISKLEKLLNIDNPSDYRKTVFDKLVQARSDYSSLSSLQLLKKDLKIVKDIPVAGLPLRVIDFLERQDTEKSIKKFCEQYCSKVVVIIGLVVHNNEVERDIAICNVNGESEFFDKVKVCLTESLDPSLQLEEHASKLKNCVYYKQKNIKATRKHIIPLLKKIQNMQ